MAKSNVSASQLLQAVRAALLLPREHRPLVEAALDRVSAQQAGSSPWTDAWNGDTWSEIPQFRPPTRR
jgi:hypothetical protein